MVVDLAVIQSAISSLNTAGDIAKGMLRLKSLSEVQGKVIELQNAILAAQTSAMSANASQSALLEEIRVLKKEIADTKAWGTEKERYQLYRPWEGTDVVYALKESMSGGEPPHYICTKCFGEEKKSILQSKVAKNGFTVIVCSACGSEIHTHYRRLGNPVLV